MLVFLWIETVKTSEITDDGTFIARENGAALRWTLAGMGVLTLLAALGAHLGIANIRYGDLPLPVWAGVLLGAGICFLGALAVPSGEARFCAATRQVRWTRTQWGRTQRGEADFSHVLEVQTQRFGDSESDFFRVALHTARDLVPLLHTSDENEAIQLAQAVRVALRA